jgi:uncharacterized Zn-binding protein involved in type VI secretion
MKRFLILNGHRTTANGVIQAMPTTVQLSDKDVAHEGDPVACSACNTTGKSWFRSERRDLLNE